MFKYERNNKLWSKISVEITKNRCKVKILKCTIALLCQTLYDREAFSVSVLINGQIQFFIAHHTKVKKNHK